jgi:hypothetical protein
VQVNPLGWSQCFADGPLRELVPEPQHIAVGLKHAASQALFNRIIPTVG